jgi:hypothetical protein
MGIIVGQRLVTFSNSNAVAEIGGYIIHTFNTPGASSFIPTGSGLADVLIVGAGGGAGASTRAGGGGGGSVLYYPRVPFIGGVTYPFTVGQGGAQSTSGSDTFVDSNIARVTAPGGAFGGNFPSGPGGSNPLGSGGGNGGPTAATSGVGAGIIGYGFPGSIPPLSGGHGGGAGGAGQSLVGGDGLIYNISGVSSSYGGGGGGAPNPGPRGISPTSNFGDYGLGGGRPYSIPGMPGIIIIRHGS